MAQTAIAERPQLVPPKPSQKAGDVVPFTGEPPEIIQTAKSYPPKIAKKLMAITREFGAIAKGAKKNDPNGGWNDFHNYGYQKWEDVLQRESVLLAQHGIIIQQSEVARSLLDKLISITYEFTIITEDGEAWPDRPVFTAIGRLQDHKGIFDDKAANKCHTQAHKYFLLHTFKIKTKETIEDEADAATDENPPKQIATPKPPRPGSPEAAALEGPREIVVNGAGPWADAFIAAIERAANTVEIDGWVEANKDKLTKLEAYPEHNTRVKHTIIKRGAAALTPKPPRPGAAVASAPAGNPMPNPVEDAAGWITWLTEKFAGFETYEAGEVYWNETVSPTLDGLDQIVQDDAMGVWRHFERRFES